MDMEKRQKVKNYISKVINDACESEGHPKDSSFSAYIIDGDTLVLFLYSKYARVYYRTIYRLKNNLKKNFGLSLGPVKWSGRNKRDWVHEDDRPAFTMDDSYVSAGYCVAQIIENGHQWFISVTAIGEKSEQLPKGLNAKTSDAVWCAIDRLKKDLEEVGGSLYYYDDLDTAYKKYRSDFQKAYGESAPEVSVEKL